MSYLLLSELKKVSAAQLSTTSSVLASRKVTAWIGPKLLGLAQRGVDNLLDGMLERLDQKQAESVALSLTGDNHLIGGEITKHQEEIRALGKGASGSVRLMRVRMSDDTIRLVARKDVADDVGLRLANEVCILAKLRGHENVIEYIGAHFNMEKFGVSIYMEPAECNLADFFEGSELKKTLSVGVFRPVLCHMLRAISYLHKLGLIHGDIKPENFLVVREPKNPARAVIKLSDFGGCQKVTDSLPFSVQTDAYAAPEMYIADKASLETDVFGVAATFLHTATGRVPERDTSDGSIPPEEFAALARAIRLDWQGQPDPIQEISEQDQRKLQGPLVDLIVIVWAMLDKDARRRPTAHAAQTAIEALSDAGVPIANDRYNPRRPVNDREQIGAELALLEMLKGKPASMEAQARRCGAQTRVILGSPAALNWLHIQILKNGYGNSMMLRVP